MNRRQTMPSQWLIINGKLDPQTLKALRQLPRSSGIFIIHGIPTAEKRRLRAIANLRGLTVRTEARGIGVRVHNARELTRALLGRPTMVLISPIYETETHPGWKPLARMRSSALARLCTCDAVSLGGMNRKRYRRVGPLGFSGWAGISAFRI